MQVSVTFRHMEPTQALKDFAAEKVDKIERYVHSPTDATVVLSVEKKRHQADITIKAQNGMLMRGREQSEDMYASIDGAMSKIERQVMRYKKKLASHKQREGQDAKITLNILEAQRDAVGAADVDEHTLGSDLPPEVKETREVSARLMTVDEAVMQMDLLNSSVFVFTNAKSGAVNVLYRRDEGNMGLLETPTSS